jgi:phytoene/squalene synthetase
METQLASHITRAASSQTYYTVRLLVDRERVDDAYRAYAYFRWVDDTLDSTSASASDRQEFLHDQQLLLGRCLKGDFPKLVSEEENLLLELLSGKGERHSLCLYLINMMKVMAFDAHRRGRLISQAELDAYTRWLAIAVTECIHHFVGHGAQTPHDGTRYLAVSAAHIAHMLRDTFDDAALGYYNIPREVLESKHIGPQDVQSPAYRAWVRARVEIARQYFKAGRSYFARVHNVRCRLACFAYIARFEWVLATIEREGYCLRFQYDERKSAPAALRIGLSTLSSLLQWPLPYPGRPEEAAPVGGSLVKESAANKS